MHCFCNVCFTSYSTPAYGTEKKETKACFYLLCEHFRPIRFLPNNSTSFQSFICTIRTFSYNSAIIQLTLMSMMISKISSLPISIHQSRCYSYSCCQCVCQGPKKLMSVPRASKISLQILSLPPSPIQRSVASTPTLLHYAWAEDRSFISEKTNHPCLSQKPY